MRDFYTVKKVFFPVQQAIFTDPWMAILDLTILSHTAPLSNQKIA